MSASYSTTKKKNQKICEIINMYTVMHFVYCHEVSSSWSAAINVTQTYESPLLQNYTSSPQIKLFISALSALLHVLPFHRHHKPHADMNVITNAICSKSDM
jgi:hypothetical protein